MTMRVSLLDDKNHMSSALTDMYSIFRKRLELTLQISHRIEKLKIYQFLIGILCKAPTHSPQHIILLLIASDQKNIQFFAINYLISFNKSLIE